jgi:hypothetical protein
MARQLSIFTISAERAMTETLPLAHVSLDLTWRKMGRSHEGSREEPSPKEKFCIKRYRNTALDRIPEKGSIDSVVVWGSSRKMMRSVCPSLATVANGSADFEVANGDLPRSGIN